MDNETCSEISKAPTDLADAARQSSNAIRKTTTSFNGKDATAAAFLDVEQAFDSGTKVFYTSNFRLTHYGGTRNGLVAS